MSSATEKTVDFAKIPQTESGTRVYLGQAQCSGSDGQPYMVKVRATVVDGKLARLEDDGTNPLSELDYAFWTGFDVMGTEGMPACLHGMTLAELISARTTPGEDTTAKADAVSGATISSDAVKYAAIAALRSTPIHESVASVLAPTLKTSAPVAPNESYESIQVVMCAEKDAVIRYRPK